MDAALPVEVVERRPSAVYLGQVYDQSVVLDVVDGPRLVAFDPDNVVSPEMVGTTRDVELDVGLTRDATVLPSPEHGIEHLDGELTAFRGRIVNTHVGEKSRLLLDVGSGTVITHSADVEEPVSVGDHLEAVVGTPYIYDVEGFVGYSERYEFFVDRLGNDDPVLRRQAALYLGQIGSELALKELIETLKRDPNPEVRTAAATALGRIGMAARPPGESRDPRIQDALRSARNDIDGRVGEEAELALADIELSDEDHHHSRDWDEP